MRRNRHRRWWFTVMGGGPGEWHIHLYSRRSLTDRRFICCMVERLPRER